MSLTFVGKDPESGEKACPSLWVDGAGNIVVQGWNPDDQVLAECLATGPVPDSEGVVVLPARMVDVIRKACELAEHRADVR